MSDLTPGGGDVELCCVLMHGRHLEQASDLKHPAAQNVGTALTPWD